MCGVAAIIGRDGYAPDPGTLRGMADVLRHRGPDDEGVYVAGHVGLASRRLAILDLTASGHQPMHSDDDRFVMVYNGEIYNYVELRAELAARGRLVHSTGDSAVLLAAWQEWGPDCLPRLNGMFAFILHDRTTGLVYAVRDRFGVKPLYSYRTAEALVLASEIKAIRCCGSPAINWGSASQYLVNGMLDASVETMYAGVEQVPAASYLVIAPDGSTRSVTWWTLPEERDVTPDDMLERYAAVFEDSVALRMRSDVPVGICLSGGMDSTSIACAMARHREAAGASSQRLLAFQFNVPEFDESEYVTATLAQTGAELIPLVRTGSDYWAQLERVIASQDEPTHSLNVLAQDGLMALAKQHGVKVVLTGEGADEALAGYDVYYREYWYGLLRSGRARKLMREMAAFADARGTNAFGHARALLRHAALRALGHISGYRQAARMARRSTLAKHPRFQPELAVQAADDVTTRKPPFLGGVLRSSIEVHPLPLFLRVLDRVSMAHSIETRSPFLDYRLVGYSFELPSSVKLRGQWNKWLLREAMRGRIPEVVRSRSAKYGFPVPVPAWFRNGFYQPVRDLLGTQQARERGVYRMPEMLADLDRANRAEAPPSNDLVRSIQFELWARLMESGGTHARMPSAHA